MIHICSNTPSRSASSPLITVVIPTYNRYANLTALCKHLDAHAGLKTSVIVIDNDSPYGINMLANLCGQLVRISFTFFRNKVHLASDANIINAIIANDAPWVYLLGDSKIPCPSMLTYLERDCLANPNVSGIIYRYRTTTDQHLYINTIDSLRHKCIDLGDLFLGGNSLISLRSVHRYSSLASFYPLSRMPHIIYHILALAENKTLLLSSERLIQDFIPKPSTYDPKLSLLECWSQFALLLCLPLSYCHLEILNRKLISMENFASRITFFKYCLVRTLKHRQDISPYLLRIAKYRYVFSPFHPEYLLILSLLFFTQTLRLLRLVTWSIDDA